MCVRIRAIAAFLSFTCFYVAANISDAGGKWSRILIWISAGLLVLGVSALYSIGNSKDRVEIWLVDKEKWLCVTPPDARTLFEADLPEFTSQNIQQYITHRNRLLRNIQNLLKEGMYYENRNQL